MKVKLTNTWEYRALVPFPSIALYWGIWNDNEFQIQLVWLFWSIGMTWGDE